MVKLAGAAYLVVLGTQALRHSWRRGQAVAPAGSVSRRSPFIQGIASNLWLCGCAVFVSRVGDELRRPRIRVAFERLTGCVLIAFGVRLATERR